MTLEADITAFLRTNPFINNLNFSFGSFRVYPSAYRHDVASCIDSGQIKVRAKGGSSAAAGASYDMAFDSLELSPSFSIGSPDCQAFLIHECTHAHLDIQRIGAHSGHANEAVAYLAEAVFLQAAGQPPLGLQKIRVVAHSIAKTVLAGNYSVAPTDVAMLTAEVATHPHYMTSVSYVSNGFDRGIMQRILR
jgi:hypothetical protein